ncbi:MAG: diguanylate cyclase response regulator, partial [Bacteroidetes bacterium]|nr:diguanylate cyclase response regulator [Bacteroidota bacterium]
MAETNGTILIVDDTPANIGVLLDYLHDEGFKVLVAR